MMRICEWNEHRRVTPEQLINLTYRMRRRQKKHTSRVDRSIAKRQVQEKKELLEKERSAKVATLTRLENTLIAMVRDNFSTS
eukprot:scaffold7310_cov154-Skeletonema_dohrnii-CCMP3373.AAC.1